MLREVLVVVLTESLILFPVVTRTLPITTENRLMMDIAAIRESFERKRDYRDCMDTIW